MNIAVFLGAALHSMALMVRVIVGVLAMLLIVRSLGVTYLPVSAWRFQRHLNDLAGVIVEPVRNLLPDSIRCRKPDFASLIIAICLILAGFGVNEIFMLMASSL